jgi:hypothetical protein
VDEAETLQHAWFALRQEAVARSRAERHLLLQLLDSLRQLSTESVTQCMLRAHDLVLRLKDAGTTVDVADEIDDLTLSTIRNPDAARSHTAATSCSECLSRV